MPRRLCLGLLVVALAAPAALAVLALLLPAVAQAAGRVPVLIQYAQPPRAGDVAAVERAGGRVDHRYRIIPALAAVVPETHLAALRADSRVAVELDRPMVGLDYRSTHDWGVAHVRADDVHARGNTGAGVRVGVLDSGVDCDHVELAARCVYGKNFVDDTLPPDDDWGHGTHVAGSIVAQLDDGLSTGVVGVAPGATVLAHKILDDDGVGSTSDLIAAVDDLWNGGARKADVVNMSVGWNTGSRSLKQAMDRAYASGMLLVAAAGNGGNCSGRGDSVSYPAKYDSVVAVAAVDRSNARPCWSSTGDQVELSAPGVSVFSTWPVDLTTSPRDPQPVCEGDPVVCHYKFGSGTSMSVPHVVAAAALVIASSSSSVWDANTANGIADEVRQRLNATAVDLGAGGRDKQYGYGLVDALSATGG